MSSSENEQGKGTINLGRLPVSQEADVASMYPSPPNSPPPTKPHVSKVQREIEDKTAPHTNEPSVVPTNLPEKSSIPSQKEGEQTETRLEPDISDLKLRLGLEGWRCGSLTQKRTPCKVDIRQDKRDQVDFQIKAMVTLIRSSPQLETELDKLVMLVHCHHHDCGNSIISRVEAWFQAFPIGDGPAKPVLSTEKKLRKALYRDSAYCLGETKSSSPCKQKLGGQKIQNCAKTVDEIVKPEVYLDDERLHDFLQVLSVNSFCYHHLDDQGLLKITSWKGVITEIRTEASAESMKSISNTPPEPVDQTPVLGTGETVNRTPSKSTSHVVDHGLLTPKSSNLTALDAAKYWPIAYDITPFNIVERSNRILDYKSSYPMVQKTIQQPLNKEDQKTGYVYLYEVEGNEGFVKIGYTSRSIETRHDEWEFDCNRKPKLLYPIHTGSTVVVQNARRIEALCHAELDHRKTRVYCHGCLKQHLEWFEISPAEAIAVVQKWSHWMAVMPYKSTPLRSTVKVTLNEAELQKVQHIEQFMEELSEEVVKHSSENKGSPKSATG